MAGIVVCGICVTLACRAEVLAAVRALGKRVLEFKAGMKEMEENLFRR